MTINYQFGDVDAHGAMIRALAGLLEAEHQAIISDVLTASDFWGGAGSAACQGFITQPLSLTFSCTGKRSPNRRNGPPRRAMGSGIRERKRSPAGRINDKTADWRRHHPRPKDAARLRGIHAVTYPTAHHQPPTESAGDDTAIWRRIRVVPFEVVIPADEQDRELDARLQLEADSILSAEPDLFMHRETLTQQAKWTSAACDG